MKKRLTIYRRKRRKKKFFYDRRIIQLGLLCVIIIFGSILVSSFMQKPLRGYITPLSNEQLPHSFLASISASKDVGENTVPTPLQNNNQVVFHGLREKKLIALTFDADMTPWMEYLLQSGKVKSYYDKNIVSLLQKTQTKATFFLTGMWIELYPQPTRDLAANPLFEIGNHSYSHPSFDGFCFGLGQIPDSEDEEQVEKTQQLLKTVAQVDGKYFRFPGGCYSQKDLDIVTKLGLTVIHWDVAGEDGFNNSTVSIEQNILNHVQNGSIIVLHLNGPPNAPKTAEALPVIIAALKAKGYEFVKVSELLSGNTVSSAINIKDFVNNQYGL